MLRYIAALAVVTLALATTAEGAFQWGTVPTPGTPLLLKYNNFEGARDNFTPAGAPGTGQLGVLPDAVGDTLEGIFRIVSIVDGPGNTYWSNGTAGQDLVGYFNQYTARAPIVNPVGTFPQTQTFGGGVLNIYFDGGVPAGFNPAFNVNDGGAIGHGAGYDGAVTGDPLFLSAVGVGGVVPTNLNVTLSSTVETTSPLTGSGTGYLTITGGFAASYFGVDLMDIPGNTPGSQDLLLQSDFNGVPSFPGADPTVPDDLTVWPATSFDPITGIYVPEPVSMVVWGMLVAGCWGLLVRRRTKQ